MASDNLVSAYERLYRAVTTYKNIDIAWLEMNKGQVPGACWGEAERLRHTADYIDAITSANREIEDVLERIEGIKD